MPNPPPLQRALIRNCPQVIWALIFSSSSQCQRNNLCLKTHLAWADYEDPPWPIKRPTQPPSFPLGFCLLVCVGEDDDWPMRGFHSTPTDTHFHTHRHPQPHTPLRPARFSTWLDPTPGAVTMATCSPPAPLMIHIQWRRMVCDCACSKMHVRPWINVYMHVKSNPHPPLFKTLSYVMTKSTSLTLPLCSVNVLVCHFTPKTKEMRVCLCV